MSEQQDSTQQQQEQEQAQGPGTSPAWEPPQPDQNLIGVIDKGYQPPGTKRSGPPDSSGEGS